MLHHIESFFTKSVCVKFELNSFEWKCEWHFATACLVCWVNFNWRNISEPQCIVILIQNDCEFKIWSWYVRATLRLAFSNSLFLKFEVSKIRASYKCMKFLTVILRVNAELIPVCAKDDFKVVNLKIVIRYGLLCWKG